MVKQKRKQTNRKYNHLCKEKYKSNSICFQNKIVEAKNATNLFGNRFSQVFACFCLACASGALWCTAQIQFECPHESSNNMEWLSASDSTRIHIFLFILQTTKT